MSQKVEFFYDIASPASYLAFTQLSTLEAETGAEIVYRPFLLPGLFQATGNASPITIPAKRAWLFDDFGRFARRYDVPFVMNAHFPFSSLIMIRGLIAYQETSMLKSLTKTFFEAMWTADTDLSQPELVAERAVAAGVNRADWDDAVANPAVKRLVFDITEEAASRGLFGAPSFIVGDKLFWGQHRIEFVRDTLVKADRLAVE